MRNICFELGENAQQPLEFSISKMAIPKAQANEVLIKGQYAVIKS